MSSQDRTLDHYHHMMQINAAAHWMRAARQLGVLQELRRGQRTLQQLSEALSTPTQPLDLLLDGLVAIGIIERYQDDFALSQTAHLLCQYDEDLGDRQWERLADRVRGVSSRSEHDDQFQHRQVAATQWIHTPAAIQAAEMLDIGGQDGNGPLRILDLGCGSAVWSCAMAHRDPTALITAVDQEDALIAARSTADSIELGERFQTIPSPPHEVELPDQPFDLVLLAQRIGCVDNQQAEILLERAISAARSGGKVVVIDLFRGPAKPSLAETMAALRLELNTRAGHARSLPEIKQLMVERGLRAIQFTFLEASKANLGMAVGVK
jgi:ubiquinone/menaquinone biosynthesis C-methylase UbiE